MPSHGSKESEAWVGGALEAEVGADRVESLARVGYRMLHSLGVGSGGPVYKAIQQSTGQAVAIKRLVVERLDAGLRQRRLERFRREIAVCSELYHPDIVRLLDSGTLGPEQYFAVFEYIPGTTLAELLRQEGMLRVQRARTLLAQLLPPLAYAHERGIAHRDLKPANIMVTPDGTRDRVKILDFGISIATRQAQSDLGRLTLSHEWVGTPAYAAPEQLRGEGMGAKADLYAWGLIFVECLTGVPAIRGRSLTELVENQLRPGPHALPPALAQHRLGKLLARVLEKDPSRRPADVGLIQSLLDPISVADLEGPSGYLRDNPQGRPLERRPLLSDTQTDECESPVERRLATVLCCRVDPVGERPGSADIDVSLEDTTELVGDVLRQFGASPVQSLGLYTLAHFGLLQARDEDVRMALRASLELANRQDGMQRRLESAGFGVRLRVGIHNGPVTMHTTGASRHPIGGVTARVAMQLVERPSDPAPAPTRILVSESFRQLVSRHAEFQIEPAALGPSDPDRVAYRLMGESRAAYRGAERLPLVGRDAELNRLVLAYRAAVQGAGAGVLLVGEAGIGKSRLARELMNALEPEGIVSMQARCLPEWQNAFLRPISELMLQQFGILGASPELASERVERGVGELGLLAREAVPLLCAALSLPLPPAYPALTSSPEKQRQLLHRYLADALLAYMDRGALLVVEDLHWADPSTLELLDTLLERARARSAFVILTSRPGATFSWSVGPRELSLGRLDEASVKQLAIHLLPSASQSELVLAQIAERSDGVPLFAEELTLAFRASAPLEQSTVQAGRTAIFSDAAVPTSLRALLTSRLDEAGAAKPMAQFAAALGREFPLELLAGVLQQDELDPLGDLEQLVSAEVLVKRWRVDSPVYAFRHALIRDNAYDSMSVDERRRAHQRIARGMERCFPAVAKGQPDILAHHFERAGDRVKALRYWREAAALAVLGSAHLEALHQLERARILLDELPPSAEHVREKAELLLARGATLVAKQGYTDPDARAAFEEVAALVPLADGSLDLAFEARFGLWHFHSKRVNAQTALKAAEELTQIAARSGDGALQASAHQALCNSHFFVGNLAQATAASRACEAKYVFERHRHLASVRGDDPHLSSLSFEAVAELMRGFPDAALSRVEQGLALAERLGYPAMRVGMHCQAAWAYLIWGTSGATVPELARVRKHAREASALAGELGFPFWEVVGALLDAAARAAAGEAGALIDLLQGVEIRRRAGATLGECWQSCFIGLGHRLQGNYPEAIATFESAIAYCERDDARFFQAEIHRNLAETLLDPANPGRDVARGLSELARAGERAARHGAAWFSLGAAVTAVRFRPTLAAVRNLESLLPPAQGFGAPPLVREARRLLERGVTTPEHPDATLR